MRYLVHESVGEDAITLDDGHAIYDQIKPDLAAGQGVELDFNGVAVFASPFFNAAIGQLLRDLKPDVLNQLLRIVNLNPTGHELLRRVIDNAKKYYASADYREAQAKALEALSERD